jgi:uncharacterized protein (DUF2252 family)
MRIRHMLEWIRTEVKEERLSKKEGREAAPDVAKARTRDSMRAFSKLTAEINGEPRIVGDPPLIVPIEDLVLPGTTREAVERSMRQLLRSYLRTLMHEHHPVEEFRYVHMARKVVGVGSVGTRSWILLLVGRDDQDPLILQAKEAQASVLERFLGQSQYSNHGQRVVVGQRLMQAASDIFLGWQRVVDIDGQVRHYYLRQLHDWKGSAEVEIMRVPGATLYARMCGRALARAHARSGDRIAIASYLGRGDVFDRALADFSTQYADQNERDYEALVASVNSGRLTAQMGL